MSWCTTPAPWGPRRCPLGARLLLGSLTARVVEVLPPSPRLLRVAFDAQGAALWAGLYRSGRPVQYSYLTGPLALWHIQTSYSARPWAAEPPSAGLPLTWTVLLELRRPGVTELLLGPGFVPRVVNGLLTGVHEPTTSHATLLQAFAPLPLLQEAARMAEKLGYLGHEFGDSCLVLNA